MKFTFFIPLATTLCLLGNIATAAPSNRIRVPLPGMSPKAPVTPPLTPVATKLQIADVKHFVFSKAVAVESMANVGSTVKINLIFKNTGDAPLSLDESTLHVSSTKGNPATTGDCLTATPLAVAGMCQLHLSYLVETEGVAALKLNFHDVAMTGSITGTPAVFSTVSLTPPATSYDSLTLPTVTPIIEYGVFKNTGNHFLTITEIAVTGSWRSYVLEGGAVPGVCVVGWFLAPGQSCNLGFMLPGAHSAGTYSGTASVTFSTPGFFPVKTVTTPFSLNIGSR